MNELLVSSPFVTNLSMGVWARVEFMGHRILHGFATEVETFGTKLLRVDVPHPDREVKAPVFTQLYGGGAIFCLTPVTEQEVRRNLPRRGDGIVVPHQVAETLALESDAHPEEDGDEGDYPYDFSRTY